MTDAKNEGYLGNTLIKKAGVDIQYTEEELSEYIKDNHRRLWITNKEEAKISIWSD